MRGSFDPQKLVLNLWFFSNRPHIWKLLRMFIYRVHLLILQCSIVILILLFKRHWLNWIWNTVALTEYVIVCVNYVGSLLNDLISLTFWKITTRSGLDLLVICMNTTHVLIRYEYRFLKIFLTGLVFINFTLL